MKYIFLTILLLGTPLFADEAMEETEKLEKFYSKLEEFTLIDVYESASRRLQSLKLIDGAPYFKETEASKKVLALLEEELDELVAINLYQVGVALHPQPWKLHDWKLNELLMSTPFPSIRKIIFEEFLAEGSLTPGEDYPEQIGALDKNRPEDRAILWEIERYSGNTNSKKSAKEMRKMLLESASITEKLLALKTLSYSNVDERSKEDVAALKSLFLVEKHPGLSKKIAEVLAKISTRTCDEEMIVFALNACHLNKVSAADRLLRSLLYGIEGYLQDDLSAQDAQSEGFTELLLQSFKGVTSKISEKDLNSKAREIAKDLTKPKALLSATAWIAKCKKAEPGLYDSGLKLFTESKDPAVRALAIRSLGNNFGVLGAYVEELKELASGEGVDENVRRAAFFVLLSRKSGLGLSLKSVLDLYFIYLQHPGFSHFGDAVYSDQVAREAEYYIVELSKIFDKIPTQTARKYAIEHFSKSFGFGLEPAFDPWRKEVVELMLASLNRPKEEDLHYFIFWNILNGDPLSKEDKKLFKAELKKKLETIPYSELSKSRIEGWIESN